MYYQRMVFVEQARDKLTWQILVAAALLLFFALAADTARQKSPTNDEPTHLARAIAIWQTGDLRLQYEHTPLSHRLMGLLLLGEPTIPAIEQLPGWESANRPAATAALFWQSGLNVERVLFLGRLAIIYLALVGGAIAARWTVAASRLAEARTSAKERQRFRGITRLPLLTLLVLFAFSPNFLASAALATTDMAAAVTYLASLFSWWHYWQRPSGQRWLLAGLCLGLALAAKLTGALLVPLLLLLGFLYRGFYRGLYRGEGRRPLLLWLGLLPVAGFVVWAIYGFEWGPLPGTNLPVLAPTYWQSWLDVLRHVDGGHPAYFLGDISSEGWWLYFPVTFLIKTPVPTLLLVLFALLWGIGPLRHLWQAKAQSHLPMAQKDPKASLVLFTALGAAVVFVAAVISRLNIGYRHILPLLPLLWVMIAVIVAPWLAARRSGRWLLALALGWVVFSGLRQHPHHLAYFNELVGGSAQGYRYLSDSNLDWGQDLRLLADYAQAYQRETGEELYYAYGAVADPAYYGLNMPSLSGSDGLGLPGFAPANPTPGRYAISVGQWQGLLPEGDLYDWFRKQEVSETLGYSILVYEVGQQAEGEWIAHCNAPAPLLTPAAAEQLVDRSGLRHVGFDCRQSWVFPGENAPGWYILPLDETATWFMEEAGQTLVELVYRHRPTAAAPGFAVYYYPATEAAATIFPAAEAADVLVEETTAALPIAVGPYLSLQRYRQAEGEWWLLWAVQSATSEPLSLLAHLYQQESTAPLVADGLGYTAEQWQAGDHFIQRHLFVEAAEGQYLQTGVYNYLTQEPAGPLVRLPVIK